MKTNPYIVASVFHTSLRKLGEKNKKMRLAWCIIQANRGSTWKDCAAYLQEAWRRVETVDQAVLMFQRFIYDMGLIRERMTHPHGSEYKAELGAICLVLEMFTEDEWREIAASLGLDR